jgi:hypothetical protein
MTHLGQENEGLAKLDEAIGHLDRPGSIDRMDAFIVACKRKINALNALRRYDEMITLGSASSTAWTTTSSTPATMPRTATDSRGATTLPTATVIWTSAALRHGGSWL